MLTDNDLKEIFGLSSEQLSRERKIYAIYYKHGEKTARYVMNEMYQEREIDKYEMIRLLQLIRDHKEYLYICKGVE